MPVDTLHQCFNGVALHLIEALKLCIEDTCRPRKDAIFATIRDRLSSYRRLYRGERIPKESLWAEKTCAEVRLWGTGVGGLGLEVQCKDLCSLQEREAIMRFLGIALHPLDGLPHGLPAFFTGMRGRGSGAGHAW